MIKRRTKLRQSLLGLVTFFGLALIGGGALAADSEELLGEMSLGSPDAPVTIVEFADFEDEFDNFEIRY